MRPPTPPVSVTPKKSPLSVAERDDRRGGLSWRVHFLHREVTGRDLSRQNLRPLFVPAAAIARTTRRRRAMGIPFNVAHERAFSTSGTSDAIHDSSSRRIPAARRIVGAERSAEIALNFWNDPVSEHVPGVRKVSVGAIFAIRDAPFGYERGDLLAHDAKHRPENLKSMRVSQRFHSSQPSGSASAQKIEEARFDLIISMVG